MNLRFRDQVLSLKKKKRTLLLIHELKQYKYLLHYFSFYVAKNNSRERKAK